MIRSIALLAVTLLLSACVSVGTPINWSNARQVKVGMTEAEVVTLMGRPYMVASRQDGVRWIWSRATGFGDSQSMSITLKDGKVTEVPPIPASF